MNGVEWSSSKYKLRLRVTLDWKKYEEGDLVLPPQDLGKCKEWRFEIATDQLSATFFATWELRMVPHGVDLDVMSKRIEPYVKIC